MKYLILISLSIVFATGMVVIAPQIAQETEMRKSAGTALYIDICKQTGGISVYDTFGNFQDCTYPIWDKNYEN